jgi:hypothetical protein
MEMEEIEQRIASDQLIEEVPWDWVVINGRMARCINPFVDLPDAADGWKSVQGRFVCEEEPRVSRVQDAAIGTRSGEDRRWRNLESSVREVANKQ